MRLICLIISFLKNNLKRSCPFDTNCKQYQQIYQQEMEIKINLDQIFGTSETQDNNHENSFYSIQPSETDIDASLHENYKYKLNMGIFDPEYKQSPASNKRTAVQKTPSVISIQSEFYGKMPGARLHYQSQNNNMRKKHELEKWKQERLQQQDQQTTFKPKINKNSEKIVMNRQKQPEARPKAKKGSEHVLPTQVRKEKQQIMHCTFKPTLIAKSSSGLLRNKCKDQVFDSLFNDYKMKQCKQKLKTEEARVEQSKKKVLTQAQFQQFLTRNNEFQDKVKKKNSLIVKTSTKFDLNTGHKMFSPKTNTPHQKYFSNSSRPLQNSKSEFVKTKPIFGKNHEDDHQTPYQRSLFKFERKDEDEALLDFRKIHEVSQDLEQQKCEANQLCLENYETPPITQFNEIKSFSYEDMKNQVSDCDRQLSFSPFDYHEEEEIAHEGTASQIANYEANKLEPENIYCSVFETADPPSEEDPLQHVGNQ